MKKWFADISVTWKLTLGFGLVLALTLILALSSWSGLSKVSQRSIWMQQISSLNDTLTDLRIARLQYMLANGDEKAAAAVETALNKFAAEQQNVRDTFVSPANVALLAAQADQISAYRTTLQKMRDAYRVGNEARADMGRVSKVAGEVIDSINQSVLQMPAYDENRLASYRAIAQLRESWLTVRYEMRGYNGAPGDESAAVVERQIETTRALVRSIPDIFGDERRADAARIEAALDGYLADVRAANAANNDVVAARADLTKQGYEIVRLSGELTKIQVERRDIESHDAKVLQISVALAALLVGMFAAWLITRQITQPLAETMQVVKRFASGDLSHVEKVDRKDEIGALQKGIADMGATLRDLITGIRDSVTQIASAAEELSAVTEQTSAGVNSQKAETDQVATAMHEMAATVQEVARNAEEASHAASAADADARQGDQVVSQVVQQIERLAGEMTRSTEAMSKLEAESNKIGSVMDVIKAVAEQTNLLALNAAIEAARAGEAGRGFAVVADEVRGLALRTQQSTEEIEQLVAGLQQGTQHVATTMQSSRSMTESSVELTRKAGSALNAITQKVSNIQAMNQQIAAAAEQQGAVADEISRSVINVRDISEQTASASEETAASSTELARLGNELQSMVSRFRV